jgi:hypothetical protein
VTSNTKGSYPPLAKYEKRKHDEDWLEYSESIPVFSCSSFLTVWKEEFPLMKIRAPSCDVCGECYIYKNEFRYKDAFLYEQVLLDVDEGADEEALDEVAQEEEQARLFIGKATTVMRGGSAHDVDEDDNSLSSNSSFRVLDLTQEELDRIRTVTDQAEVAQDQERKTNEAILTCASGHVVMDRVMPDMAKEETMYALEDEYKNVVHSKRHYVLVGDYAQNLEAPHFGGAQPGDTYYFSPLTVFLFGLVDLATTPNRMNCYAYAEYEDKDEDEEMKGANNVAPLLMRDLCSRGLLREGDPVLCLTLIFDNCGGQNKNNTVLRMAPYLVEKGYFQQVKIIFYVRGHTKNACDRTFNQLKLRYHKQSIYTAPQVIKVLDTQPNVKAIATDSSHFFKYDDMLEKLYVKLEAGTIQKNHVFIVKKDGDKIVMEKREHKDAGTVDDQDLFKRGQKAGLSERNEYLSQSYLEQCTHPGLIESKQVELYTKWRKFVPSQYWDIICPKPSDDVLGRVKTDQAVKEKQRAGTAGKKKQKSAQEK